jgi:predicted dehydrogenase
MRRITLGLIGAGIIMRERHAPALQALRARYEIVAVYSRTEAHARALAGQLGGADVYSDYQQLLERPDIEAVDIAVPIEMNYRVCLAAAQAGKAFICEKPIAGNLRDARAVMRLPAEYGVLCMTAENFRYAPDLVQVSDWVRAGRIGTPIVAHWRLITPFDPEGNKYVRTTWRQTPAHVGGFISDAGVHYVDVLRAALGEVEQVQAFMTRNQPILGSYDTAVVNLRMASGAPANLTMSWAVAAVTGSEGLEILGREGVIVSNRNETTLRRADGVVDRWEGPDTGGFQEELLDFHRAVTEGKSPEMTMDDAYRDLAVTVAAVESAETGRVIDFAEFLARQGGS